MPGQRGNTVSTYRRPRRIATLCAAKDTNDISRRTEALRPRSGRGQVSVRPALLLEPRPFCIREARRLGERKLKEWPELFAEMFSSSSRVARTFASALIFCVASVTVVVWCSFGSCSPRGSPDRRAGSRGFRAVDRLARDATSCSGCIILRYAKRALDPLVIRS